MLNKLAGSNQWFSRLVLLLPSCRGGRKQDQLKWLENDSVCVGPDYDIAACVEATI